MNQAAREKAFPTALFLYHQLKPLRHDLLYFQDGLTGYRPFPTVCLYVVLNILFFLFIQLRLSLFSHIALLVCVLMVPGDIYLFLFHAFCYSFKRPAGYVPRPWLNSSLPLPEFCARLGVIYSVLIVLREYIRNSLKSFSFVNVGLITFTIAMMFYVAYWLGDVVVTFLGLQILFFVPLVVTRKIGFRFAHYPEDLEVEVLTRIRPIIEEDQRLIEASIHERRRLSGEQGQPEASEM